MLDLDGERQALPEVARAAADGELLDAYSTAVTGAVGFICLLAPHLVRPFVGHQPSRVLLPAALLGAILLLAADVATRVIPTPQEIRLGVLTSMVGTPFFFWLVVRLRGMSP